MGAAYALRFDVGGSEVAAFERLAAAGRAAAAAENHATTPERLAEALGLWRGPALTDSTYEDWVRPEITRLEELRAATLDARIDANSPWGATPTSSARSRPSWRRTGSASTGGRS